MSYATYAQFTQVYSLRGISQAEIENYWLDYGTLRVNEALGGYFTTPFSSNNLTARDLSIHFAYYGIMCRTWKKDDSDEMLRDLRMRVDDIRNGNMPMMTTSGDSIVASGKTTATAWSNTMNYQPVFDMRAIEDQIIDPDRVNDEWDAQ